MLCRVAILTLFVAVIAGQVRAADKNQSITVTTVLPGEYAARPTEFQAADNYYTALLQQVLEKTRDFGGYQLQFTNLEGQQNSLLELARSDSRLDIVWSGSEIVRQNKLPTIKIPLLRGLLGFRVPVIIEDARKEIGIIDSVEALRK